METFSALLAICEGNSPVAGEFPAQRPVTRGFGVLFDLRLDKQLSKQSRGWWFGSHRAHYDVTVIGTMEALSGNSIHCFIETNDGRVMVIKISPWHDDVFA